MLYTNATAVFGRFLTTERFAFTQTQSGICVGTDHTNTPPDAFALDGRFWSKSRRENNKSDPHRRAHHRAPSWCLQARRVCLRVLSVYDSMLIRFRPRCRTFKHFHRGRFCLFVVVCVWHGVLSVCFCLVHDAWVATLR